MLKGAPMELREVVKQFQIILLPHLVRKQERREIVEIVRKFFATYLAGPGAERPPPLVSCTCAGVNP